MPQETETVIHIQIRLDFTNQSPCFMDDAIATLSVVRGDARASADQEPPVVIADWQTKRDTNNDHAMRCDAMRGEEKERGGGERERERERVDGAANASRRSHNHGRH